MAAAANSFPSTSGAQSSDPQDLPLQVFWDINARFSLRPRLHYVTPLLQNRQWLSTEHQNAASGYGPRHSRVSRSPALQKNSLFQPCWSSHQGLACPTFCPPSVRWLLVLLDWAILSAPLFLPNCPQLSTVPRRHTQFYALRIESHLFTSNVWI